MQNFIEAFPNLTPAGQWKLVNNKKQAIDAKRVDNLSWDRYPNDNMGRHFLQQDTLVLDIDGAQISFNHEAKTITTMGITIPYGLYTTTTAKNKFHFYYKGDTTNIANRLTKLNNEEIDIFTYGVVFEGHTFSPHNKLHEGKAPPIPAELEELIHRHQVAKNISTTKTQNTLGLTSNIQRYNLVNMFLNGELQANEKPQNAFYKSIVPQEYQTKSRKKSINQYKLSYDLFNKIAVKLTTTSELDYNEHTKPTLDRLLTLWGISPESAKSAQMYQQILPSLPQHESFFAYTREKDVQTFQEHLNAQKGTATPVFYTIQKGKTMYIEVDKISQVPVQHGDSYFFDERTAAKLHPERNIENEAGRVVGWDANVPLVYTINNPYMPQYLLDDKFERHTLNLFQPTEYVTQAHPNSVLSANNLINKATLSTIGPDYIDLYHAYSAQILFGSESPTMVMWMSALKTELGGSGKSVVSLELFSLMLGSAAAAVDFKTVSSGWGDIVTATKILSLEDMPELGKEWESVYSNIKQQNTNSFRKLNMKHGSITSERVSVSITGSTNHRIRLSPSDRRFLCLEPAHFHGKTEPLNSEEQLQLSKLLSSHDYQPEVQEYVDFLRHVYDEGFSEEISRALFIQAPETEYRHKWIGAGESNTLNLLHTLSRPDDMMDHIKYEQNDIMAREEIVEMLKLVLLVYNPTTNKSAVSWKWFEIMLPYVQSDKYADQTYSKAAISKMLHIDFKNVGKYAEGWKQQMGWPVDGYTFPLSAGAAKQYQSIIKELQDVK